MNRIFFIVTLTLITFASFAQVNKNLNKSNKEDFVIVEEPATYKGGYAKLYKYFNKNLNYPKEAKKQGIEGKVYVEFVILENGSVHSSSIRIVSEDELKKTSTAIREGELIDDKQCQQAAIELIQKMPDWSPAKHKGEFKKQRIRMPIIFKL